MALVPRAARSDADDAAFLSSGYGLSPDPWQFEVLTAWLGVRPDGKYAALRCGLSLSRQNGKNALLEMRELFGLIVLGEKILHTAHEVRSARLAFRRLLRVFDNEARYPEMFALVADIRRTNGQEAIELKTGATIEFGARSKGAQRGNTVDVLVVDEAQEMTEEAADALLPTTASAPLGNPQHIWTGTPPGPKANGDLFARIRAEGIEGKDKRISWHEWSCEPDADLDDPVSWAAANPAIGTRLQWDVAVMERGTLSDDGFGRERLGMWAEASSNRVIDATTWRACADTGSVAQGRLALAVDVNPDRTMASVSVAGQRADDLWHVEMDEQREGPPDWVPAYIAKRCAANDVRAVVIDAASPAATLVDQLLAMRIKVTTTTAREMTQACGIFYDGAMSGWLRHTDQPQMNTALGVARKRPLGDSWAWNRKNAASDITPLVACTLALFGAQSSTVKKPSRSGIGRRAATVL